MARSCTGARQYDQRIGGCLAGGGGRTITNAPAGPQAAEPRPEQPVDGSQPRAPPRLSLQDRYLMTQCGVLGLERRVAPEARAQRGEQDETDGPHGPPG